MKQYEVRPGIVKTEICGVRLLVPTRQASEACPGVLRLNMIADFAWTILCKTDDPGEAVEKIRKVVALLSKAPDDVVIKRVERLLSELCERGFLIETEGPQDD